MRTDGRTGRGDKADRAFFVILRRCVKIQRNFISLLAFRTLCPKLVGTIVTNPFAAAPRGDRLFIPRASSIRTISQLIFIYHYCSY
jgi:hypothetical protein